MHSALDRNDIDLVLRVPDRDYDAGTQAHHVRRIQSRKEACIGGIIVAGEVLRLREDLVTFCRESRLPVVFADLEPFPTESEYPARTAFIGYDTGELGEMAGCRTVVASTRSSAPTTRWRSTRSTPSWSLRRRPPARLS